jgi:hypothetical protein
MADKKRDILEFVEQSNFEQFTPTRFINTLLNNHSSHISILGRIKFSSFRQYRFLMTEYHQKFQRKS